MTMTPTQTVQAFLDAFARHDVDAAIAVVDPQVSVTVHPFGLESSGADVLRGVLADLMSVSKFSVLEYRMTEIEEQLSERTGYTPPAR